jgi:hypothetical protein
MASKDAPFGLVPWGPMRPNSCHYYANATTPAVAIFHGDPVQTQGTALLTPHMGNLQTVEVNICHGSAGSFVGVVMGIFDADMKPLLYSPTTTAGDDTISGYILVCDDPMQRYIVAEDGAGSSIVLADIGLNGDLALTHTGNTDTGRSKCELDSSDVAAPGGATGTVKVLGVHPEDTISAAAAAGNHARFIVIPNSVYLYGNLAGV